MAAELTPQQFRQVYREAEPRAAHAKLLNPAADAPDSAWHALAANRGCPMIPAGASIPTNAIAAQLALDEIFVARAPGKWFTNGVTHGLGAQELGLATNSARPSIAPGPAGSGNAIGTLLEQAGEAP